MYTVYKHTAPGGKVYIGITGLKPARRWGKNGEGYSTNSHFFRAIELYGWENIQHEIIAEGLTKAQAAALEIELIAKYDSANPAKGYNCSTGGEASRAGVKASAETRRKMSEALTNPSQETRRKMSEAKKGKLASQETRLRMSEAHTGSKRTAETRRKMSETRQKQPPPREIGVICLETGTIYPSSVAAAKATGANCSSIRRVCKGEYQHTHGLHFQYIKE